MDKDLKLFGVLVGGLSIFTLCLCSSTFFAYLSQNSTVPYHDEPISQPFELKTGEDLVVFFPVDFSTSKIDFYRSRWLKFGGVSKITYTNSYKAYEEYLDSLDPYFDDTLISILESKEDKRLPASLGITFKSTATSTQKSTATELIKNDVRIENRNLSPDEEIEVRTK